MALGLAGVSVNTPRQNLTQAIYDHLRERFGCWVDARELAQVGGFCAWRTRVSDARDLATAAGYEIVWNADVRRSAYMLRRSQPNTFSDANGNAIPLTLF